MAKTMRDLRWRLLVPALGLLQKFVGRLSRRQLLAFGQALGLLVYLAARRDRLRAQTHLTMIFPSLPRNLVLHYARRCFDNLCIGLLEALAQADWTDEQVEDLLINPEEFDRLRELSETSKGAVFITAHLGNWELLASSFARRGGKLGVVGRRMHEGDFDGFLARLRRNSGFSVFYSDESPKEMVQALRTGTAVGILPDQDVSEVDGTFVDFLDRPAYTPTAPAKLAVTFNRPLIIALLVREGERFRIISDGPLPIPESIPRNERDAVAAELTAEWSRRLSLWIRRYPDQWVWMHRRWRNTPERIRRRRESAVLPRQRAEAESNTTSSPVPAEG